MRGFTGYHPAIQFLYYILIICFAMVSMHPVILVLSLLGAFLFFVSLSGIKKLVSELLFCILLCFIMSVFNPLFNHNGETVLFFMNEKPITWEAMLYGGMMSLMLAGVLVWCRCYSQILTTDKWLYLFGKIMPKIGLVLSMAFRYIPLFQNQVRKINQSQKTMGLYATESISDQVSGGIRVFDSLISWSMENSIDTADAMKARGYGLPGRSSFSLFHFCKRDGILLGVMLILAGFLLIGFGTGIFDYYYYPVTAEVEWSLQSVFYYGVAAMLLCIPGFIEIKEKVTWNYLKSRI